MTPADAVPALADRLPAFPWDALAPAGRLARSHPDGIVDLSVGTPVDPVPQVVTDALAAAANSPGYPMTAGTRALREAGLTRSLWMTPMSFSQMTLMP